MSRIIRDDLSERLIHLTKGEGNGPAKNLLNMLNTKTLIGGNELIKGRHSCVCLSEAPISAIGQIIASKHQGFKYSPYGLMFSKTWIFEKGGLPVIYQPEDDYQLLPDEKKHLHMRFDLSTTPTTDFTWEREWRIKCTVLPFSPEDVTVIVPNRLVSDALRKLYHQQLKKNIEAGETEDVDVDPWHYIVLEDLGVSVEHGLPGP